MLSSIPRGSCHYCLMFSIISLYLCAHFISTLDLPIHPFMHPNNRICNIHHLDVLHPFLHNPNIFFWAARTIDRSLIRSWQKDQTPTRSPLQAVQLCSDMDNYQILWLSRFCLAWNYPALEIWCLALPNYTMFATLPSTTMKAGAITTVRGAVRFAILSGAYHAGIPAAARWLDYTFCIQPSKMFLRFGDQHLVNPTHWHCGDKELSSPSVHVHLLVLASP